ncbi:MAG: CoA protein activase [bacterium]
MPAVTFPHMGYIYIALKSIFASLGSRVIIAPRPNKNTLYLASKYAPELTCLPLKINLGNLIEALNLGANLIVTGGGEGPCRFGYYGEIQRRILGELGYNFELVSVNQTKILEVVKKIKYITKVKSTWDVMKSLYFGWTKMKLIESSESNLRTLRLFETREGECERIFFNLLRKIDNIKSLKETKDFKGYIDEEFSKAGIEKKNDYLKIAVVGEIFMVLEPFVNFNLEKRLSEMGIYVDRTVKITNWLKRVWSFDREARAEIKMIKELAKPYLKKHIGGEGLYSIGQSILSKRQNFDGVIQIAPFTCMPEIVAYSIFPKIMQKEKIPVLSLFLDEHSSETGIMTRVEAFVDLIKRQKFVKHS